MLFLSVEFDCTEQPLAVSFEAVSSRIAALAFGSSVRTQSRPPPESFAVARASSSLEGRLITLPMRFATVSLTTTCTPERLSMTDAPTDAEEPSWWPPASEASAADFATLTTRTSSALARLSSRAAVKAPVSAACWSWARREVREAYSIIAPAPSNSTGSARPNARASPPRSSCQNCETRCCPMAPFWNRPASDTAKVLSNRKHAQNQEKPASRSGRTFDLPYVNRATLVISAPAATIYFVFTIIPRRSSRAKLIPA